MFAALCLAATAAGADEAPPVWAYPIAPQDYVPPKDDGTVRQVPGSIRGYTLTEIRDLFVARDWFPQAHPPMPPVVAEGRKPNLRPCGVCHRPEGVGGPENASLAGLPAAYMLRQIDDFRSGARSTGVKERAHVFRMITGLKELTDDEIRQAVAYYASQPLPARIRVVETDSVPASYVPSWYYTPRKGGGSEPLAGRIIEMPDDEENFINRDSRVTFTAYVPVGSLALGGTIAREGSPDRIVACIACHGERLEGVADIPPLAGRSPSYIVRQLYEFKHGLRGGSMAEPMKENAARMTVPEMVALAAYAASLTP
ncbi:cytochrome C [Azospirillum sp. TSH100]|nr:cytochrome C [Azospirillum sp. TSH100]